MTAAQVVGYKLTPDLEENDKNPLLDISMDSNKELWLLQWPKDQHPDFGGQEVNLRLHHDGQLGSFETSSGKSYELISFASQDPGNASVFQSSKLDSKVVGKIARRVSLVHYVDPSELDKSSTKLPGQLYQRSVGASSMDASRRYGSASRGSGQRSGSGLSHVTKTPSRSSRQKYEIGGPSRSSKKKHDGHSQDSVGRDHSGVSSLGSAGHSPGGKSKKIKHEE